MVTINDFDGMIDQAQHLTPAQKQRIKVWVAHFVEAVRAAAVEDSAGWTEVDAVIRQKIVNLVATITKASTVASFLAGEAFAVKGVLPNEF